MLWDSTILGMTDADRLTLAHNLKKDGYIPVHWRKVEKGFCALLRGKVAVPAKDTGRHVCLVHGNAVKLHTETHPGDNTRGVRFLTVHPCLFCQRPQA